MANFYCKWCGAKYTNINSLTTGRCMLNPLNKTHELYEGSEKSQYICKYCGTKSQSLTSLTGGICHKSPMSKHHQPAL